MQLWAFVSCLCYLELEFSAQQRYILTSGVHLRIQFLEMSSLPVGIDSMSLPHVCATPRSFHISERALRSLATGPRL